MAAGGKASLHVAVWEWQNSRGAWRPYSPEVSQLLERGYHKHLSSLLLGDADPHLTPYTVSLSLLKQQHQHTGTEKAVRRAFLSQRSPAGSGVVWQWSGGGSMEGSGEAVGDGDGREQQQQWHDYAMPVQCVVEDAWAQGAQTVDIFQYFPEYPYIVDFCNLTQHNLGSNTQRAVRRQKQASYPVARPPPGYTYPGYIIQGAAPTTGTLGRREQRKQQHNLQHQRDSNQQYSSSSNANSLHRKNSKHNSDGAGVRDNAALDECVELRRDHQEDSQDEGTKANVWCYPLLKTITPDYQKVPVSSCCKTSISSSYTSAKPLSSEAQQQHSKVSVVPSKHRHHHHRSKHKSGLKQHQQQQQQHHDEQQPDLNKHEQEWSHSSSGGTADTGGACGGQSAPSALLSKVLNFGLHLPVSSGNSNNRCSSQSASSRSSTSSSSSNSKVGACDRHGSPLPPPLPHRSVAPAPQPPSTSTPLLCSTLLPHIVPFGNRRCHNNLNSNNNNHGSSRSAADEACDNNSSSLENAINQSKARLMEYKHVIGGGGGGGDKEIKPGVPGCGGAFVSTSSSLHSQRKHCIPTSIHCSSDVTTSTSNTNRSSSNSNNSSRSNNNGVSTKRGHCTRGNVSATPTPLPRSLVPPTPLPRTLLPPSLPRHLLPPPSSPPYMLVTGPQVSPCPTLASCDGASLASGRRASLETISTYLSTDDGPHHSSSDAHVAHILDFSMEDCDSTFSYYCSNLPAVAFPDPCDSFLPSTSGIYETDYSNGFNSNKLTVTSTDASHTNSTKVVLNNQSNIQNMFFNENYLLPISSRAVEDIDLLPDTYDDFDDSNDEGEVFTSADQEVRQVMSATIARTRRHTVPALPIAATGVGVSGSME